MNPEEITTTIPSGCDHENIALGIALDWCSQHAATVVFHRHDRGVYVKVENGDSEFAHRAASFMEAVAVCRKAVAASEG